jgi:hypothetical protein
LGNISYRRVGRHHELTLQGGRIAPREHLPTELLPLRAEQMVSKDKLNFLGQHIAGGVGRGAADFQVQLDAAFFGHIGNDGVPVRCREIDIELVNRRKVVDRLLRLRQLQCASHKKQAGTRYQCVK